MSRFSVLLGVTSSLILSSFASSQTSGTTPVRPGSTTSAPRPGIAAPGQRPQTGTARIRGRIVAAQTGLPIRRALNTLGILASAGRSSITNNDGRFEFTQLTAGRYAIVASKAGFITLQYGRRRPTNVTEFIVLADGERRDGIDLALPRRGWHGLDGQVDRPRRRGRHR